MPDQADQRKRYMVRERTDRVETEIASSATLFTPGLLYTTGGGAVLERQAAFGRANQHLCAILYFMARRRRGRLATRRAAAFDVGVDGHQESRRLVRHQVSAGPRTDAE